ncbi:hypothetical protein H0H93_003625, partial [Arthromyces matolae]
ESSAIHAQHKELKSDLVFTGETQKTGTWCGSVVRLCLIQIKKRKPQHIAVPSLPLELQQAPQDKADISVVRTASFVLILTAKVVYLVLTG